MVGTLPGPGPNFLVVRAVEASLDILRVEHFAPPFDKNVNPGAPATQSRISRRGGCILTLPVNLSDTPAM
jgi:hypothetical protein